MIKYCFTLIFLLSLSLFGSQKTTDTLANFSSTALFDLDKESLKKTTLTFLENNQQIKAFIFYETNEIFLAGYRENGTIIFQEKLPKKYLNLKSFHADISFDNLMLGEVSLYYDDMPLFDILTPDEKKWIKDHPIIKVGGETDWPPFDYVENGEYKGIAKDYLDIISKKTGLRFDIKTGYTWTQLLDLAKNKEIDLLPVVYYNEERTSYLSFTKSYFNMRHYLYTLNSAPNYTTLHELTDKTIAITKGFAQIPALKATYPKIKILEVTNSLAAIDAVITKKADAFIANTVLVNYYTKQESIKGIKASFATDLGINELHMAVRNDWEILSDIVQKALENITLEEKSYLSKRWFVGLNNDALLSLNLEEQTYLKQKPYISMCVDPNWMPYEKVENGRYLGIGSDYIKLFEDKLQTKFKLIPTKSWVESKQKAKNAECEVLPLSSNSKKRKEFMNVTEPYLKEPIVLATKINSKFVADIKNLAGKKIGITKGYSIISTFKDKYPFLNIVETKDLIDGLRRVEEGELFGQLDAISSINYYIQELYWNQLKISSKFDDRYELGIASNKEDLILHAILTKLIASISEKEHKQIYYKWNLQERVIQQTDYSLLWKILSALCIIILAILYWNYKLKRLVEEKTKALQDINENLEKKVSLEVEKNRQNEIHLLEQSKMAQMGEMIGNIAHQWRQPLSAISMAASAIKLQQEVSNLSKEELNKYMNGIIKNTVFLSETIDTFRDFIMEEKVQEEVILQDVINDVLNITRTSINNNHIELTEQLHYNEPIKVTTIPKELSQVIINILNNARDVLKEKNIEHPSIVIELKKDDKNAIITIEDNAKGIPEDILPKIFDPYFTTKHQSQGTGLGLHMSKKIIHESLKGRIYARNSKKGAIFFIELPLETN